MIGGGWLLFSVGMTMMMDVSLTYVLDCYPDVSFDQHRPMVVSNSNPRSSAMRLLV